MVLSNQKGISNERKVPIVMNKLFYRKKSQWSVYSENFKLKTDTTTCFSFLEHLDVSRTILNYGQWFTFLYSTNM